MNLNALIPSHPGARRPRSAVPGFSIQETMIAVAILGIGLILVAAVFPVALAEHRLSTEAASASALGRRAAAMMPLKIDRANLWKTSSTGLVPAGQDGPWVALPLPNLNPGGGWAVPGIGVVPPLTNLYANVISNLGLPANNGVFFGGADLVSDLRPPQDDADAEGTSLRTAWYGFYRETAAREFQYAAAICRHVHGQTFAVQDLTTDLANAFVSPAATTTPLRLPVPWRVTVAHPPGTRELNNIGTAGVLPLGWLAPPGAKIMVTGWVNNSTNPVPGGRVLAISAVDATDAHRVEVLSFNDVADLPIAADITLPNSFDVWVFPPPWTSAGFDSNPALIDWEFF